MISCDHQHSHPDLTCERLVNEFLLDYFEGTLPEAERAAFESHLAECAGCVRYLDSYRKTVMAVRGCGEGLGEAGAGSRVGGVGQPPEALVSAIMDAARRAGVCGDRRR